MKYLYILCLSAVLTACASAHKDDQHGSAKEDYQHAQMLMAHEDYAEATIFLEKFSSHHPYSEYTTEAELLRIESAYRDNEYVLSETLALRFMKSHPRHSRLDYVRYMLGMSYVRESGGYERDQTATKHAVDTFKAMLKRYPHSKYAASAVYFLQKMTNQLSAHELYVGKFYFNHGRYVAAVNRFQQVLQHYQTTPSIEEALYYLCASYHHLNLAKQAKEILTLLQYNYPQSTWREQAAAL